MSDTLDDGLREQLAAALLGWGGGPVGGVGAQRLSRDTIDSTGNDSGRATPKAMPTMVPRQGQIRSAMEFADEGGRTTVDDDIDADSVVLDASDTVDGWSAGNSAHQQARRTTNIPNPAGQKALPSIPFDTPIASPPAEMSCRISRFPFTHPCDMPELMPDQEDIYGTEPSPSVSAPVTPNVLPGVFRPSAPAPLPNPGPGPYLSPAPEPETRHRMRKMSIQSYETAVSDDLCRIDEEGSVSDVNTDGVSLLSPTEVSGGTYRGGESDSTRVDRQGFLTVASGHWRSVSSLGSGSSGESRPAQANTSRRSSNLFSRIRNGGRTEEQYLEKRSLTPIHLDTPPRRQGDPDDELLTPDAATPTTPSYNSNRAEPTSTTSRFFGRMPWLGDSQPKKPEAVFGVDLKESIRVAPMKIRISHKGRSTSYRTFPLAVYKSCDFIRRAGGTDGNIFSTAGNAYSVANLKTIFSLPPTFGEQFHFEGSDYTVHDAARLILVFLEELPKPLISPSVVKSWILLARQEGAIEPPCPRVETGLDFWTEALNRLPTVNRNLTKHLLTLFAEVLLAAAGEISEADARQLASAVSRAMFHHDAEGGPADGKGRDAKKRPGRRNVQPTLALAFLIKKRGEYALSLGNTSNDAKRDSKLFLPTTKEMMEWKGMGP